MKAPIPYLNFPGTCEEAFNFYKAVFGGELVDLTRFSEMPSDEPMPPAIANQVMHVSLVVKGTSVVMGSDAPEGFGPPFQVGNNVSLSLDAADEAEAKRWFDALCEGGEVVMPLEPTFWAKLFAMVSDKYGVQWMISLGEP
ncbi:MAG: VOC family protein [Flavobacteriales bacterium]|nr:VOC family protein [Flavobacteriales bacterium]